MVGFAALGTGLLCRLGDGLGLARESVVIALRHRRPSPFRALSVGRNPQVIIEARCVRPHDVQYAASVNRSLHVTANTLLGAAA
jgi:hypothetical protein